MKSESSFEVRLLTRTPSADSETFESTASSKFDPKPDEIAMTLAAALIRHKGIDPLSILARTVAFVSATRMEGQEFSVDQIQFVQQSKSFLMRLGGK